MFVMRRFAVVRRTRTVCKRSDIVTMRPPCVAESSGASAGQITTNRDHGSRLLFMMFYTVVYVFYSA